MMTVAEKEERALARDVRDRLTGRHVVRSRDFPSSSNPDKTYTANVHGDGSRSCNCPAWTRRNPPGGRTCRHVQDL